jgi:ATP-dependent DNA ligase
MAPALARPPFHPDGWVYEEKVDGWRMLAYKEGARVRLISCNAVDHTTRFRELARAIASFGPTSSCSTARSPSSTSSSSVGSICSVIRIRPCCARRRSSSPDILQVGAHDVRSRPLEQRRAILEEAIAGTGNSQLQCATFSHRFSDKMRHLLRRPGLFSVRVLR